LVVFTTSTAYNIENQTVLQPKVV